MELLHDITCHGGLCIKQNSYAVFTVPINTALVFDSQTKIILSNDDHMSRLVGKPTKWFPNRSDTNRSAQSQKRAGILKFRIQGEEELYYPSSENKGADQLRSYCEADLRLCFRLGRLLVFPCGGSYYSID